MAADIALLATDLDGTLIGSVNEFPLYETFRDRIDDLRLSQGLVWAACTGRSRRSFMQFFSPMRTMGIAPDFVIIKHAFIYGLARFGYVPHLLWNSRISYLLWAHQIYVRNAINEWHQLITGGALGVRTVRKRRDRLWLRFESEEAAASAGELLRKRARPYRQLRVFEYRREVDVRMIPFTKGLAVSELARHLGIASDNILTIGNGHNDISMFDTTVAAHTGCPVNSEPEVMEVVHRAGGHIATQPALRGVLETMDAYQDGRVCSELPSTWEPPSQGDNPSTEHRSRKRPHTESSKRKRTFLLLLGIVYAVLVVLARFGLVPFGDALMKPFVMLEKLATKVLGLFYGK